MDNLNGVLGSYNPTYLLAGDFNCKRIAVSVEPGNGTVPMGTVLYRKADSALYTPAASADVASGKNLVILGQDVDTDASETVAAAAVAYESGEFFDSRVIIKDGTPITAAHQLVLRAFGYTFKQLEDLSSTTYTEADNTATVNVTVENDGHGTGAASPSSGTKGTEVTLTATPSSNYALDYWEVVSGDVTVANNKFVIGEKAVTVKAHFKATT